MTVVEEADELGSALAWFHCNECHRSFHNHNRLQNINSTLRLLKSDLTFAFTSCGHVFCENCIRAHTDGEQKFTCTVCRVHANCYRLNGSVVPKKLEMYLQPPTSIIEDAVTVMMFQLNNANELIGGLRAKIAQQKDLLARAKQELSHYKKMKEQISELEEENESLKKQLVIANKSGSSSKSAIGSPAISIRMPTPHRISIKSPSVKSSQYPAQYPQQVIQKSPAISEESGYTSHQGHQVQQVQQGHQYYAGAMPPGSYHTPQAPPGGLYGRRGPSSNTPSTANGPSFYYGNTPRQGVPMNYYSNDPFLSMAVNTDSPSLRPMRPVNREYPRPSQPPPPPPNY